MLRPARTRLPEKRKVDSSILSLTTHYHQRICVRELRKHRWPDRLAAARP